ncbi:hypothetical protein CR513_00409, partial [Mucuna pruriens]
METLVDESRFEIFGDHKNLKHSLIKRKTVECETIQMDYNFDLSYHLGKVNVLVNTLSRKSLDLRNSNLVCEVTLKSMKLGMLKVLHLTKLRKLILQIGLNGDLGVQLGAMRTYQNLRKMFGLPGLKEELPGALETKVKIDYKLAYVIRQLS